MPAMDGTLWLLIGGAALAGLVQGLSGFAFAMVAMSVWVWGLEPRTAATLAIFGGLVGQLLQLFTVPRTPRLAVLGPYLLGAAAGLPLGLALLPHLDLALFKLLLGSFLVLCCPALLLAHRLPVVHGGGRAADALVGLAGGVMGGLGGFSGVLPTLWSTLRRYDRDLQRGVIQNFSLATLSAALLVQFASGAVTRTLLPQMAVVVVALLVPSRLGTRLYRGLDVAAFRRVVLLVLSASGLAMLGSGLVGVLGR
jgi:hypothetical protein